MKPFNYKIQILFEPYFFFFLKTHGSPLGNNQGLCCSNLRKYQEKHAWLGNNQGHLKSSILTSLAWKRKEAHAFLGTFEDLNSKALDCNPLLEVSFKT